LENLFLGKGHFRGFAREDLDTARGATGVASAGMELIATDFFAKSINEAFSLRNLKFTHPFDG
jgi:hypothetical protein